jgi:GT2 family glycosyltransferase
VQPVVYIPNWNGGELLLQTLSSLSGEDQAQIVVVDNGSSDGSAERAKSQFPDIECLEFGENLGFGRALNRAVSELPGDPVIFLNNDVECETGFLEQMLDTASRGAEMVAGVLVQADRPTLIDSAGVVVEGDTLLAFDYLHGELADVLVGAPPPLGPCGGAALFRRDAFESLQGFDERIFIYLEDVDLALRAAAAGMACLLARNARARHAYSASLGSRSGAKYERTGWSRGYLLRRYGIAKRPAAARALLVEGAICAGQLVQHRTAKGLQGRIAGWHAGAGLPVRELPTAGLLDLSMRERLRRRANRRR